MLAVIKDIIKVLLEESPEFKILKVSQGINLVRYMRDENPMVRQAVATWGELEHLGCLVTDEDRNVRAEVARRGFFLEELYQDEDWLVRFVIAEQGLYLEEFKNDKDKEVSALANFLLQQKS